MNEAKEKAKELVDKFLFADIYFTDKKEGAMLNAKECALIACDFTIEQLTPWKNTYSGRKQIEEIKSVKQEITKL